MRNTLKSFSAPIFLGPNNKNASYIFFSKDTLSRNYIANNLQYTYIFCSGVVIGIACCTTVIVVLISIVIVIVGRENMRFVGDLLLQDCIFRFIFPENRK